MRSLNTRWPTNSLAPTQATLSHGQLDILGPIMTNARLAMAEARAAWSGSPGIPMQSPSSRRTTSSSPSCARSCMDLSIRANDIERRVGKDHLAAVKVRNRMEEVREAIAEEQKRIAGSFEKDYELARARYDELSAAVSRVMGEEGANSNVQSSDAWA